MTVQDRPHAEKPEAEMEQLRAEHAEMQWALENIHMLARRAMNATTEAKCREKLPHILRICEQQSPKVLGGGVLRSPDEERPQEPLSARWQELFWALPPGEMRHKLRALEIDTGRAIAGASLVADLASALKGIQGYAQHKAECDARPSFAFKCSGCGYVTANRAEDRRASNACKGYCQSEDCRAAYPCPQCQRKHYWGGYERLERACTCELAESAQTVSALLARVDSLSK